MNRIHCIFGCLILMAGMLTVTMLRPEPKAGHGVAHPEFERTMNQGGESDRHQGLGLIGWVYGGSHIIFFTLCLTLGLKVKQGEKSHWANWLTVATLLYLAMFTAMMAAYAVWGAEPGAILGMPTATSLFVIGMWATPFLFTVFYIWHFRIWVFDEHDAKRFAELKLKYKTERSDG